MSTSGKKVFDNTEALFLDLVSALAMVCGDNDSVAAALALSVVLKYRKEHFCEGNNKLWGEDNWIECRSCPVDAAGFPPFHHKQAH